MIDPLKICCPCDLQDSHKNNKLIIQCTSCKKYQHKYCMKSMVKMPRYQCPYCQFKKGALFFNILYSLVEPSFIEFNPINKLTDFWVTFIPDTTLYSSFKKKFEDSPMVIIIRCLRLDKNGFSFHWPKMSKIYINDKIILDMTRKGSKQRDRMIALIPGKDYDNENIQKHFFLYDSNIIKNEDYLIEKKPNRFGIEIILNEGDKMEYKNFLISIDLCEIYKEAEPIINDIPIFNSKTEIKNILLGNENEKSLSFVKEKISLLDIYTETDKIKIPARGISCCHLNVFDLKTFLVINRKTNKFQCPYCKRYSNDLYIDGIIYDFLKDPNNENINEIFIDKEFNISIDDKNNIQNENNYESNNNSYSNDETCKTEIKKNIEKYKRKESINLSKYKNNNLKYHKQNNLIRIIEDESDKDNNDNYDNNDNIINENDFNNNNCNIISDLGQMFDRIREDILSDKKNIKKIRDNNFSTNKSIKKNNQDKKSKSYEHIPFDLESYYGYDLTNHKYRYSRKSKDSTNNLHKKRKRNKNTWINGVFEHNENYN